MDFQDLLAPVGDQFDVEEALDTWRWLVPQPVRPLVVTAFGDLFLIDEHGAVLFLDTAAGRCSVVADSVAQWETEIQKPENLDEWFMPGLLAALWERGSRLSQAECFDAVHDIALGGDFSVENWAPIHWRVHFSSLGRLFEQIKDLPSGTTITKINYDKL